MSTKPVAQQVVPGKAGPESSTASRGAARPRESWFHLCGTADAIRYATDADEKRALLEPYLGALDEQTIGPATRIFAGQIAGNGPLTVSRTLTASAIRALTRASAERLLELTMKLGDLGDAAGEVFSGRLPSGLSVSEVERWLNEVAAAEGETVLTPLVRDMLAKLSGIEAQYLVRLLDGGLRIGLDATLVAHAMANTFREPIEVVREAVTRSGDIGMVAELARKHTLPPG